MNPVIPVTLCLLGVAAVIGASIYSNARTTRGVSKSPVSASEPAEGSTEPASTEFSESMFSRFGEATRLTPDQTELVGSLLSGFEPPEVGTGEQETTYVPRLSKGEVQQEIDLAKAGASWAVLKSEDPTGEQGGFYQLAPAGNGTLVGGWAILPNMLVPPEWVLLVRVSDGSQPKFVQGSPLNIKRPDVAEALKSSSMETSGFQFPIDGKLDPGERYEMFAVDAVGRQLFSMKLLE